jgi:HlyD family secretion protein
MMKHAQIIVFAVFLLSSCGKKTVNQGAVQSLSQVRPANEIVAIGRVEPELKITPVGAQVNGIVKHLFVHEGDTVNKGQMMIEMVHDYEDAQLQQAQTKLATQQAEIENVAAQLASVKLKMANLGVKLQRAKNLVEKNAETQQNLDNAKTDYDQSVTDIERYTAALNSEKAKLNEMNANIAIAAAQIAEKKIIAPADGVVLSMDLSEGASITTGKSLFDFAPLSPLTVLCEVDELLANSARIGQKAYIRNQGTDQKLADGEVIYVSPYLKKKSLFSDDSGNMEDRRVREVRIRLNGNAELLYGTRVEAIIDIR